MSGMEDDESEQSLVMPFVVTKSHGGPYSDDAFIAGCWFGKIQAILELGGTFIGYVPTPLVIQLDLLAMHHGKSITSEPWEEAPEEHALVTIS